MPDIAAAHDLYLPMGERLEGKLSRLSDASGTTLIRGGTVLDGRGGRFEDWSVRIEGARIAEVGPALGDPPPDTTVIDAAGATVLPGLIDAHVHFMGTETADGHRSYIHPSEDLRFIRAAFELYHTLASGFTTVRALGHGPAEHAYALREAVRQGLIVGPRLLTSGWALSQTRGHGDVRSLPYDFVEHARPRAAFCDGEVECRKMVRRNFGEGADVIKVYASDNRTGKPDFTVAELTAIADEAHRRRRRVATHAKTYDGVLNALRAGIDTIEHGPSEVHPDLLAMMRDQGAVLVPTMATVHRVAVEGAEWGATPAAMDRARRELEGRQRSVRKAAEMGVSIAVGSDAGARGGFGLLPARELELLCGSGLRPLDAITAATWTASQALGLENQVGSLEPGKLADVVIVDGDLVEDIARLQDRRNVRHIVTAVDGGVA